MTITDARGLIEFTLDDLDGCFLGDVPAALATVSADGIPNITYLSNVARAEGGRVAVSTQFLSKTARNLVDDRRASLLIVDGTTHEEYRLELVFERTDRRGSVCQTLQGQHRAVASLAGAQNLVEVGAADIYRVEHIVAVRRLADTSAVEPSDPVGPTVGALADLCARLGRVADVETLAQVTVAGLTDLFGPARACVLLFDEAGANLVTTASHGYSSPGVGSTVPLGVGLAGAAALRCEPIRVGNLRQLHRYAERFRDAYGFDSPAKAAAPGLPEHATAESRVAVPAMVLMQPVGVVLVECDRPAAFTDTDVAGLQVVAAVLGGAVEAIRRGDGAPRPGGLKAGSIGVRHFRKDGSTFLDGEYLIKGVAGRLLWALLSQHRDDGRVEFTNREMRLDPSLDLPDVHDNFGSRLILLTRRLEERDAPIRIAGTGRGRFELLVSAPIHLDEIRETV